MKHILAVHQGYELYGSDRTFISSLVGIRNGYSDSAILVKLPKKGELADFLLKEGFQVEVCDLWILRRSYGILRMLLRLLAFPAFVWRARNAINSSSACYINTSVVFDYAVAARFSSKPCFIHVHEIPTGLALKVIRSVLVFSKARLIFNSEQTFRAFGGATTGSEEVLLNGVPFKNPDLPRTAFSAENGCIHILMIGRINSWKGQDLLLRALAELPDSLATRISVRFLGAAFEEGPAEKEVHDLAKTLTLKCRVNFDGFVADPANAYEWSDLVVVPSKKPEPFGLVAVEAMAHGRLVVAANHGGLTEIVLDGKTGILVRPNDPGALADALVSVCEDPEHAISMALAGRLRYQEVFSEERYQSGLLHILRAHPQCDKSL